MKDRGGGRGGEPDRKPVWKCRTEVGFESSHQRDRPRSACMTVLVSSDNKSAALCNAPAKRVTVMGGRSLSKPGLDYVKDKRG